MVNPSPRQRRTIPLDPDTHQSSQSNHYISPYCDHFFVKERSIVFFNDWDVQIREIEHLRKHSDIYEKLWYSKTDYNLFGAHDELIVKIARAGNFHETAEHSIRGLEKQLGDGTNDMERIAVEAVQQEQQRQKEHRINHPDVIASIYRLASMSSKHEARIRGIQDALQVNQSPMLGFSIDGEHYCDEKQNRRRKPRSRSMIHTTAADVDHSSSHRSVRNSFHSHPITTTDRKYRSSSLHQAIIDTKKREPIPASRRKPRSVSMLGSITSNSNANEPLPERIVSPQKTPSSKSLSMRTSRTNDDTFLSSNVAFGKDAVAEESIPKNREKVITKSPNKRESKKTGSTLTLSRSPRKRRSSIEHTSKLNNIVK